jgi:class 3 adenylate cyclase
MPEERKLVTVLFADVVSSTAFGSDHDPEVVRSAMGSYFERMKGIAEMHGGTVEKFMATPPWPSSAFPAGTKMTPKGLRERRCDA